ncbi:MAG: ParB/RepB/Spo0J family partition protein [Litorimonas sp.]
MSDKKKTAKKPAKKKASDRGLGRGLSALMSDISVPLETETKMETKAAEPVPAKPVPAPKMPVTDNPDPSSKQVQFIAISRLERNPDQPRKMFNEADMAELTTSISRKGVLQPILVRPIPPSARSKSENSKADYQIVAGERRWQASLKAGLDAMPVLIRELTDQEVLEIGVVENVQRADLNPMEEARAYRALMDDFGRTQQDVSDAIGKSRSHIANLLRMLDMPLQIQRWLELGKLSLGHAKAIMPMPDPIETAEMVMDQGFSVRATEAYVKRYKDGSVIDTTNSYRAASEKDPNITKVEQQLTDLLGLKVSLKHKGPGGELKIKYRHGDQLEDVMRRLRG